EACPPRVRLRGWWFGEDERVMPQLACPRCGKVFTYEKVADTPCFPFCSRRCKLIDLGEWLDEEHRISSPLPAAEAEGQGEDGGEDEA
ncbi:MAG TPA: DNA gyrase inhibitor YacG, partial [Candidatus Brocadiia bacterium]|nr:DNA gyrase inhibitor YacG [Candidatus Brocadiia bacterium]